MLPTHSLRQPIRNLHTHIQTAVVAACEQASLKNLADRAVWRIVVDPYDLCTKLIARELSG